VGDLHLLRYCGIIFLNIRLLVIQTEIGGFVSGSPVVLFLRAVHSIVIQIFDRHGLKIERFA
jgi:hypothetical protein